MFFMIAGIQPKTKTVDHASKSCPLCGLHQVYTQRVDHYLSLFFIPLFRVKKGMPFLYCQRCRQPVTSDREHIEALPDHKCSHCGQTIQKDFRYCPNCGQHR